MGFLEVACNKSQYNTIVKLTCCIIGLGWQPELLCVDEWRQPLARGGGKALGYG